MCRTAGQDRSKKSLQIFIENPKNQRVIAGLAQPSSFDFDIASGFLATVCKEIPGIQSWENLYRRVSSLRNCPNLSEVTSDLRRLLNTMKTRDARAGSLVATHRQKRKLIVECGLRQKSYSVADILSNNIPDTIPPITVLWRERSDSDRKIRRYTYLSEYEGPEQLTGKRIERTTDYDMIYLHNDESHIVLSGSPDKFEVELMALRQVPTGDGLYSEGLMSFLSQAVDAARDVRRNIRPTHDGVMNQIGLNMGPRHCRVFGAAKSFTKKLTDEQMISHDHDIIGAVSVFWAICQAILPEDIRSTINQYMEDEQLPALQTRNVEPGSGFTLHIKEKPFFFPYAPRAPPEAYINKGYGAPTHTDPTYCCFALAFIVRRVTDRSHPARQGAKALQDHMGGNYVDVRLGVIVASAAGTILAFKPGEMHATTLSHGACNYGYAITFSRRLADGYRELSGEKKADYFIKSEEIVSHA